MLWVKRIFIGVFVCLILLFAGFYTYLRLNEDVISQRLINKLNEHLVTPVEVEKVNVHLFYTFPRASVSFDNVIVMGSEPFQADTLMNLERISFSFSMMDLFNGNYTIERLNLYRGKLHLRNDQQGRVNYDIWEKGLADETMPDHQLDLILESVRLRDVELFYQPADKQSNFVDLLIKDAELSGNFNASDFKMNVMGQVLAREVLVNQTMWMSQNQVTLNQILHVNTDQPLVELEGSGINIDGHSFILEGIWKGPVVDSDMDIYLRGEHLKLSELRKLVPAQFQSRLDKYDMEGEFDLDARIKGTTTGTSVPGITVNLDVHSGYFRPANYSEAFTDLNFLLTLNKPANNAPLVITINELTGNIDGRPFLGNVRYHNPDNPHLTLNFNGVVDLSMVYPLIKDATEIDSISGKLDTDLHFTGLINDLKSVSTLNKVDLNGKFTLSDAAYHPSQRDVVYENLNGQFSFDGNDLNIARFNGNLLESDFEFKGYVQNMVSWFFVQDHKLVVNAMVNSANLNIGNFIYAVPTTESMESDSVYEWAFPEKLAMNLEVNAKRVTFDRFSASGFTGKASLIDHTIYLDGLKFAAMEGDFQMKGSLSQTQAGSFDVNLQTTCRDVGIRHLFYQCHDFGQKFIRYDHMDGKLDGDIYLNMRWNDDLSADLDALEVIGDLKIVNGKLENFEPVMKMSGFLKDEMLADLKFNELNNRILIKDRKVLIPEMDISSNALDILLAGEHTFDNNLTYYMRLNLHHLLFGKKEDYVSEFGNVVHDRDDNILFYLVMTGTDDDINLRFDNRTVRAQLADQIANEKRDMEARFGIDPNADETSKETPAKQRNPRERFENERPSRTEKERDDAFQRLRDRIRDF